MKLCSTVTLCQCPLTPGDPEVQWKAGWSGWCKRIYSTLKCLSILSANPFRMLWYLRLQKNSLSVFTRDSFHEKLMVFIGSFRFTVRHGAVDFILNLVFQQNKNMHPAYKAETTDKRSLILIFIMNMPVFTNMPNWSFPQNWENLDYAMNISNLNTCNIIVLRCKP